MSEQMRRYHQDHGASLEEAEMIVDDYLEMANKIKTVKTQQNLQNIIQCVEALKQQVSRYNHESSKYRWSRGLEKEVLDKLNKIKA